ncbi:MAG: hypothetical protein II892_00860, partial [Fibrobacter sp.]|nr:hypothetical protein [Fibrobacter sp.]
MNEVNKSVFCAASVRMTPEGQNGAKRHFAIWLPRQPQSPNRTTKSVRQNTRMNEVNKSVFCAASVRMTPEGQNGAKRHFAIWLPRQ